MTDTTTQQQKYQQLIAKCWSDEAFKQRLLADPAATLQQDGWGIPDGVTIEICEDSDDIHHIVIPQKPMHLDDEELREIAAGFDQAAWLAERSAWRAAHPEHVKAYELFKE